MQEEIWKDIPNYEGYYQASNLGRIKSLSREVNTRGLKTRTIKSIIRKQQDSSNGYKSVSLSVNGHIRRYLIHRLIAQSFLVIPCITYEVNHKNGDKTDNRASNLEWCTHSENIKHSYEILNRVPPMSGRKGKLSPFSKPVYAYNKKGELIDAFISATKAAEHYGICNSSIGYCCRGRLKTVKSLIFKF